MKRRQKSIKWKFFAYLLLFTLLLILLLWLFQIVYLDKFYRMIKTGDANKALTKAAEILKEEDDIEEDIEELALEKNISILVMDTEGSTVYCSEYMGVSRLEAMPVEERLKYYEEALRGDGDARITIESGKNQGKKEENLPEPPRKMEDMGHREVSTESVIYVRVLEVGGEKRVILLNTLLTPVEATVQTLQVQLIWITGILIILALVLAAIMSKRVSWPIVKVNDSAKKLAKGDYSVTFEGKDYKEIAELSDTLNFAAKELEKTEGFRRELLANVSHDLRTPLTMIIAYAEVMRDLPGENTPENIQVIIDESKRLTNLVNDMLDISKLQAGVMEKNESRFNLTKSIESVLERYHKLKEQEGYHITFSYEEEVMVEADEFKIGQVIYNLINNAINYTGEDKTVMVRQRIEPDSVRIEVEDTGEGICKEDIPYVWERYYKVDKTHKRAVSGTGLGLSIVKNILELHEAEFGVESEIQKGSVFWFTLKKA